jgi:hypothetical protein
MSTQSMRPGSMSPDLASAPTPTAPRARRRISAIVGIVVLVIAAITAMFWAAKPGGTDVGLSRRDDLRVAPAAPDSPAAPAGDAAGTTPGVVP